MWTEELGARVDQSLCLRKQLGENETIPSLWLKVWSARGEAPTSTLTNSITKHTFFLVEGWVEDLLSLASFF